MQDGALPHITRCVTDVLEHHFTEERVISRQFHHLWPPRSPDLNSCDFWLWGHLKQLDLIRVVENLDGSVESTDTIVKLKTKIENSSTFESDPDFVKTLIQNCIDERVSRNEREVTLEKQKIELAELQLAKLEKEIELQTAKNKALSLNPAAKVEENSSKLT
ncbi:uncharacterized protein TNCV_5106491 [Trichonephila clavipes]|nr:uncharacterized protein TNCV_5106491 [Trichonephila clavipes]